MERASEGEQGGTRAPAVRGRASYLAACLAALGGGLWCASYAWPMLDPFRLDVVLRDDWAQHTLGWLFFRNEPLRLPLGRIDGFLYPLGTTLGYMDAIPWVALMLRPVSALLPADFQYLGLWVVACSAALAFVAARVAALWTPWWEQQALAGLLTSIAPTLIERLIHPALCAHALIVLAIGLCFTPAPTPSAARRQLIVTACLLTVSSATHPYLAVMVLTLVSILPWKLRPTLGSGIALIAFAGQIASVALTLAAFGYIGREMLTAAWGFGHYSANLDTFVNSMGLSRLFPGLPQPEEQYEGYSYMGAGWLALCACALGLLAAPPMRRRVVTFDWSAAAWPLTAAASMALFALASPVRWGDRELFSLPLYEHLSFFTSTFRSSGRFVWPLLYAIELTALLCVLCALRERRVVSTSLLLAALALQLYDVDNTHAAAVFTADNKTRANLYAAPAWDLANADFDHLVIYPAEIQSACNVELGYRADVVSGLAYLAYRHRWTINSGYAARNSTGSKDYCDALERDVVAGQLDARSLYVTRRWKVRALRAAGATCGRIEPLTVCVATRPHPLVEFLARHPP